MANDCTYTRTNGVWTHVCHCDGNSKPPEIGGNPIGQNLSDTQMEAVLTDLGQPIPDDIGVNGTTIVLSCIPKDSRRPRLDQSS